MTHDQIKTIARLLRNLSDYSTFWDNGLGFTKQYLFHHFSYEEISNDEKTSKIWFDTHKRHFGRGLSKIRKHFNLDFALGINLRG